jgi:hypothetical protein
MLLKADTTAEALILRVHHYGGLLFELIGFNTPGVLSSKIVPKPVRATTHIAYRQESELWTRSNLEVACAEGAHLSCRSDVGAGVAR